MFNELLLFVINVQREATSEGSQEDESVKKAKQDEKGDGDAKPNGHSEEVHTLRNYRPFIHI